MSLLTPDTFGRHPYMPNSWKSKSVLTVGCLGLQVLMCYLGAAGKIKIMRVLLKTCQLFSGKTPV